MHLLKQKFVLKVEFLLIIIFIVRYSSQINKFIQQFTTYVKINSNFDDKLFKFKFLSQSLSLSLKQPMCRKASHYEKCI